ncbi:MAG: hypothetical protein P4L85_20720 [Paludisphaera borealis]|uniref:hypothetical protein n=1 Tax=Paludisphaera borealis TaxID=1387353 RepID=UPI00284D94F6|nr:hypothetical protein [Paludisphaera borealis]MDR3621789.1 hypothetical protein [Paludisphaera borealis]
MKRHLMTLAFSALVGSFLLVNSAEACHKSKKVACAAPAPVCEPAPVCAPAPVVAECAAPAKKHCFALKNPLKGKHLSFGHGHKKAACEPAPAPCGEVVYSAAPAPIFAAPVYAAPQASAQN